MIIENNSLELFFYAQNRAHRQWDQVLVLQGTMILTTVEGQEHSPIRARAQRGFLF